MNSIFLSFSKDEDLFFAGKEVAENLNSKRSSNFTLFFVTQNYPHFENTIDIFKKVNPEPEDFIQGIAIEGEIFKREIPYKRAIIGCNFFKEKFLVEAINIENAEKNLDKKLRNSFQYLKNKAENMGIEKFLVIAFLGKNSNMIIERLIEEFNVNIRDIAEIIGILPFDKGNLILFKGGSFKNGLFLLTIFPFSGYNLFKGEILRKLYSKKSISIRENSLTIDGINFNSFKKRLETKSGVKQIYFGKKDGLSYRVFAVKDLEKEMSFTKKKENFQILTLKNRKIFTQELISMRKDLLFFLTSRAFTKLPFHFKETKLRKITKSGVIGIASGIPFFINKEGFYSSENMYFAVVT